MPREWHYVHKLEGSGHYVATVDIFSCYLYTVSAAEKCDSGDQQMLATEEELKM